MNFANPLSYQNYLLLLLTADNVSFQCGFFLAGNEALMMYQPVHCSSVSRNGGFRMKSSQSAVVAKLKIPHRYPIK